MKRPTKMLVTTWIYSHTEYQEWDIPNKELNCLNLILSEGRLAYVMRPMRDWCLVMVNLLDTALTNAFSSWKLARETSFDASTTKARSNVTGQVLVGAGYDKKNKYVKKRQSDVQHRLSPYLWSRITCFKFCFEISIQYLTAVKGLQPCYTPSLTFFNPFRTVCIRKLTLWFPRVTLHSITPESHIRSREERKWSPNKEALDCETNSPCQHYRKGIQNSIENMYTNFRVGRVTRMLYGWARCLWVVYLEQIFPHRKGKNKPKNDILNVEEWRRLRNIANDKLAWYKV